jgi:chromosome segregation ATPase
MNYNNSIDCFNIKKTNNEVLYEEKKIKENMNEINIKIPIRYFYKDEIDTLIKKEIKIKLLVSSFMFYKTLLYKEYKEKHANIIDMKIFTKITAIKWNNEKNEIKNECISISKYITLSRKNKNINIIDYQFIIENQEEKSQNEIEEVMKERDILRLKCEQYRKEIKKLTDEINELKRDYECLEEDISQVSSNIGNIEYMVNNTQFLYDYDYDLDINRIQYSYYN